MVLTMQLKTTHEQVITHLHPEFYIHSIICINTEYYFKM